MFIHSAFQNQRSFINYYYFKTNAPLFIIPSFSLMYSLFFYLELLYLMLLLSFFCSYILIVSVLYSSLPSVSRIFSSVTYLLSVSRIYNQCHAFTMSRMYSQCNVSTMSRILNQCHTRKVSRTYSVSYLRVRITYLESVSRIYGQYSLIYVSTVSTVCVTYLRCFIKKKEDPKDCFSNVVEDRNKKISKTQLKLQYVFSSGAMVTFPSVLEGNQQGSATTGDQLNGLNFASLKNGTFLDDEDTLRGKTASLTVTIIIV